MTSNLGYTLSASHVTRTHLNFLIYKLERIYTTSLGHCEEDENMYKAAMFR